MELQQFFKENFDSIPSVVSMMKDLEDTKQVIEISSPESSFCIVPESLMLLAIIACGYDKMRKDPC